MTSRFASLTEQDIENIVEDKDEVVEDKNDSVRVISLSLRLRLITPTSTLIILDITKTSSNNCLLLFERNLSTYEINTLQHGKCFVQFLFTRCFVSENSLVRCAQKSYARIFHEVISITTTIPEQSFLTREFNCNCTFI